MEAEFVRDLENFTGSAKLWKLSSTYRVTDYTEEVTAFADFVITSATNVPFSGPETYVFPASPEGEVLSWSELEGSFQGSRDHEKAIKGFCEAQS